MGHTEIAASLHTLGYIRVAAGSYDEAIEPLLEAATIYAARLGAEHEHVAAAIDDGNGHTSLYSILRNREHSNISGLFSEDQTHLPVEDNLTVTNGIVGDYPSAFWRVDNAELESFGNAIGDLRQASDYADFMTRFGVRRSHADFWIHSDKVLATYAEMEPVDGGLLDYNRLENR